MRHVKLGKVSLSKISPILNVIVMVFADNENVSKWKCNRYNMLYVRRYYKGRYLPCRPLQGCTCSVNLRNNIEFICQRPRKIQCVMQSMNHGHRRKKKYWSQDSITIIYGPVSWLCYSARLMSHQRQGGTTGREEEARGADSFWKVNGGAIQSVRNGSGVRVWIV